MKITRFAFFDILQENIDSVESANIDSSHTEPNIEAQVIKSDSVEPQATADQSGDNSLEDLSKALGVPIENNTIKYRGKRINYFSESDTFDVNGEKFNDVGEILKYLKK